MKFSRTGHSSCHLRINRTEFCVTASTIVYKCFLATRKIPRCRSSCPKEHQCNTQDPKPFSSARHVANGLRVCFGSNIPIARALRLKEESFYDDNSGETDLHHFSTGYPNHSSLRTLQQNDHVIFRLNHKRDHLRLLSSIPVSR